MSGNPTPRPIQSGDHTPTVTGPTPMSAGPGCHMKTLGGPLIIMAVGSDWKTTAGGGFQVMSGDRPGSRGEPAEIMSAGRLCLQLAPVAKLSTKVDQSADTSMSSSELDPPITT